MPAPSKSWVTIVDSQVDADSPLDTILMTGIRDNLIHLEEWIGKTYTAAIDHNHDGINSAVPGPPAIQSSGSQVISASATWTPSAGTYQMVCVAAVAIEIQLYISGAWRGFAVNGIREGGWSGIFDGANMRFLEVASAASTLWYQKFN